MSGQYAVDDSFKISEEIENLSEEELGQRIAVLEQKAIEEGKIFLSLF